MMPGVLPTGALVASATHFAFRGFRYGAPPPHDEDVGSDPSGAYNSKLIPLNVAEVTSQIP